jgi:hypothetical protein
MLLGLHRLEDGDSGSPLIQLGLSLIGLSSLIGLVKLENGGNGSLFTILEGDVDLGGIF